MCSPAGMLSRLREDWAAVRFAWQGFEGGAHVLDSSGVQQADEADSFEDGDSSEFDEVCYVAEL